MESDHQIVRTFNPADFWSLPGTEKSELEQNMSEVKGEKCSENGVTDNSTKMVSQVSRVELVKRTMSFHYCLRRLGILATRGIQAGYQ